MKHFLRMFMVMGLWCVGSLTAKTTTYACPWPHPEFSVLGLKPVNMLRVIARPYANKHKKQKPCDVPFSSIAKVEDQYVYLFNDDGTGLQLDVHDSKKRPLRYTYRYLFVGNYGILASASDGKPVPLETFLTMVSDIDPITKQEGMFVSGYDLRTKKSYYDSHLLIPSRALNKVPSLDELPFSVSEPLLTGDLEKRTLTCDYPQEFSDEQHVSHIVLTGPLPIEK